MFAASKPSVVAGNVNCSLPSCCVTFSTHGRDEVRLLDGDVYDLTVLLVMPPHANPDCSDKQHEHAEPKQPASRTASPRGPAWRGFRVIAIGRRERRPRRRLLQCRRLLAVVHSGTSSKTPWACLPSLPMRSIAKRYGTRRSVVGVANRRPPITARASAAFCSSPGSSPSA